jgi:hypothetical protein
MFFQRPVCRSFGNHVRLLFAACLLLVQGCSSLGVEPWRRDVLSQSDMTFGAPDLAATFSSHFYFSKEASGGGQAFAAGGCGCN